MRYARYAGSRLGPGSLTAHGKHRLMLLGSPPDMVHGFPLRETGSSTLLAGVRRHIAHPRPGIHPRCSGLREKGTASSPTSAALSKVTLCILLQICPLINVQIINLHHVKNFTFILFLL